jgi:hypothetical protein
MLQVSANGTDWVVATCSNKVWVTADDAVTFVTGIGNLTARVIDTAGNVTALPLSNNGYSSLAKTRLLPKVKLTLTTLSLVMRSLANMPVSLAY